jgi:glycosyltransferase involved in cell wall biosynthesis
VRNSTDSAAPALGEVRKVLMTADTLGGVWTYALELSRALTARGVEVTLATQGAPLSPDQWTEARAISGLTIEQSTWKLEWMDEPWDEVKAAGEWLLELESRYCPDVVHLNSYSHAALPWTRPVLVSAHSCLLSWWEAVHEGEELPERSMRYRFEVGRGLRAAGRVVAPSQDLLSALVRHYGPLERAAVIPHGRRAEDFLPSQVREPFILSSGRLWDEAKNVAALETVAPTLNWPVLVAGETQHPMGGGVRMRHVRLLGRLPLKELSEWMSRASIYALPARYEPFGLSALEAALAGCALVLGDIPSLREVWEDAAVFVTPDDPDMLSRALRRLATEPVLRARMATLARTRALQFAPELQAESYLTAYTELVHSRRAA